LPSGFSPPLGRCAAACEVLRVEASQDWWWSWLAGQTLLGRAQIPAGGARGRADGSRPPHTPSIRAATCLHPHPTPPSPQPHPHCALLLALRTIPAVHHPRCAPGPLRCTLRLPLRAAAQVALRGVHPQRPLHGRRARLCVWPGALCGHRAGEGTVQQGCGSASPPAHAPIKSTGCCFGPLHWLAQDHQPRVTWSRSSNSPSCRFARVLGGVWQGLLDHAS